MGLVERQKPIDIVLMDEFLRGFPEVYNALLDIFTSRRVGNLVLPKVFIMGASNSVVTYDQALEDRLLHVPVPDPRRSKAERERLVNALENLESAKGQLEEDRKRTKMALTKKLKDKELELKSLHSKQKEYKGYSRIQEKQQTKLRNLTMEIAQMKRSKVEIMRKLETDRKKFASDALSRQKEILALKRLQATSSRNSYLCRNRSL